MWDSKEFYSEDVEISDSKNSRESLHLQTQEFKNLWKNKMKMKINIGRLNKNATRENSPKLQTQ